MKKHHFLFITIIAFSFFSCQDERVKLIADYEQTIFDSKIDLSFKSKNTKELTSIKAIDSLNIIEVEFNKKLSDKLEFIDFELNLKEENVKDFEQKLSKEKYPTVKALYFKYIEENKNRINELKTLKDSFQSDCKGTFLEDSYNKIQLLKSKGDSIIANRFVCTYTIVNPMLNNAKQELTKLYYFTPDNKTIIRTEIYKELEKK